MYHPRNNDQGKPVKLFKPSTPSDLAAWHDANAVACVVPDGPMPEAINGIPVQSWLDHPVTTAGWEALAASMPLDEPDFVAPPGLKKSAGVVVIEPDGRVWVVAPSNQFGGYEATFPKGRLDGRSPKAAALVEVFEESGLQVRLKGYLLDIARSTTYTRYYVGERIGGNPAEMGWESQAVILSPARDLNGILTNANDTPIIKMLGPSG